MVKSVLGVNHQGLRDWLIQRISAIVMVIYVMGLLIFFETHPGMAYYEWHELFSAFWMKLATLLTFSLLLYHAWVGMWTVFTDYVSCAIIRLVLHTIVLLLLIVLFLAALLIVWSV